MHKEKATLGRSGECTADPMCAEYTPLPHSSQPKLTLKHLISSKSVRGYLLQREEYLLLHPDKPLHLIEAVRTILNADAGREVKS